MSDVVVVRVPKKLKEEMKKIKINWSKFLRQAIEEQIRREKLKELWKDIEDLRSKIPLSPEKDFSVKSIREDREQ